MEITGPSGGRAAPLDNITPPPAGKQNSRNKQSPRSANKGFSDLLIGEMLLLQDEKRTVHKGKVLFGDATPTPALRLKLDAGDFAPNPFYSGVVHRRPRPERILSLHVWVTSQYLKDVERCIISI